MSSFLQLEEPVQVRDSQAVPQLLVNWSSRWEDFLTSIKPALARSEARLAGEAPFGLVPFRVMIPSYVVEAFVLVTWWAVRDRVLSLRRKVARARH